MKSISKEENSKLTIITINWNNADGLAKTVQSVIKQTWKEFQYVVIDGASTDNSLQIIEKFEKQIDHWVSEPDTGIYNAMNKGVDYAKGEYCLFLNSGDYLHDDRALERVFKDKLSADIHTCALLSESTKKRVLKLPPKEISLFTFVASSILHPSTFMKREMFFKHGRFDEGLKIISDWKLLLEWLIVHNCSYSFSDEVLTVFEAETGISSTSSSMEEEVFKDTLTKYFPRIMSDYHINARTESEYYFNVSKFLVSNPNISKWFFPIIRTFHAFFKCRKYNQFLIRIIPK